MKVDEINKLTERQAKDKLIDLYASPYIKVYFSLKTQIDKLSKEIEDAEIDFKEDSVLFKNFMQWGKESLTITSNLEQIISKIDRDVLREEAEKRTRAEEGTIESYVKLK